MASGCLTWSGRSRSRSLLDPADARRVAAEMSCGRMGRSSGTTRGHNPRNLRVQRRRAGRFRRCLPGCALDVESLTLAAPLLACRRPGAPGCSRRAGRAPAALADAPAGRYPAAVAWARLST